MDKLKLKIKTPILKLELEGDRKQVFELRKLFSEINKLVSEEEGINFDEIVPTNLSFWKLTKDFQKNESAMELINEISQIEEGMRIRKVSINNINEITDDTSTKQIDLVEVKNSMEKLFLNIDKRRTNYILIHIISDIDKTQRSIICDQINKQVPYSKIKELFTKKEIFDKTIIECIFFGNYPDED